MKAKNKSKNFLITTIAIIVVVSILTSYTTFLYLQRMNSNSITGRAGQAGSLDLGTIATNVNVIIVESTDTRTVGSDTDYGIPGKTVTFPSVAVGGIYATNITNASGPHPFLIRNVGGDSANVSIYASSAILTSPTSKIEFWAQPGKPQPGGSENWNNVDNCGASCYDTTKTAYTGDGGTNFCNSNPTACCATSSFCLPISSIQGSGNQKVIIYKLNASVPSNEAFLQIKVSVGSAESSGSKSGTINIVGSYTT